MQNLMLGNECYMYIRHTMMHLTSTKHRGRTLDRDNIKVLIYEENLRQTLLNLRIIAN